MVPVPPSNGQRPNQPVIVLARELSRRKGIELCEDGLRKSKQTRQLKDVHAYSERLNILKDAFAVTRQQLQNRKVLLFDDLFRSGATLNAITNLLYNDAEVASVNALTITKTRSRS